MKKMKRLLLKFSNDELVMTRFSSPKSIMRFIKMKMVGQSSQPDGHSAVLITTDLFQLEAGHLQTLLSFVNSRWRTGICQLPIIG